MANYNEQWSNLHEPLFFFVFFFIIIWFFVVAWVKFLLFFSRFVFFVRLMRVRQVYTVHRSYRSAIKWLSNLKSLSLSLLFPFPYLFFLLFLFNVIQMYQSARKKKCVIFIFFLLLWVNLWNPSLVPLEIDANTFGPRQTIFHLLFSWHLFCSHTT